MSLRWKAFIAGCSWTAAIVALLLCITNAYWAILLIIAVGGGVSMAATWNRS